MAGPTLTCWSDNDFCLDAIGADEEALQAVAVEVYERVCRTNFIAPGFCLVDLGSAWSSQKFRECMIALKRELRRIHRGRRGCDLVLLSAARFDQQVTTKPHRDGGPEECFLMLGYEPSDVRADILIADYAKCAFDMGITPSEFLDRHNPMFAAGERLLEAYTTRVRCFSNDNYQVLLINNSIAPFSDAAPAWQGVLHTATIQNPDTSRRRVINSLMVASVPLGEAEPVTEREQEGFIQTSLVRRAGYDRPDLADDK
jgi:hypothetical protein